jgi:hypothetical protein
VKILAQQRENCAVPHNFSHISEQRIWQGVFFKSSLMAAASFSSSSSVKQSTALRTVEVFPEKKSETLKILFSGNSENSFFR